MFRVSALAVPLHVEVEDDEALAPLLCAALGDLVDESPLRPAPNSRVHVSGRGPWRVSADAHAASAATLEEALTHALTAVNLTAVAETPLLAFHAAVVSRGGKTLVIPGRSGLGKSTFTACLLRLGWSYVSDEALAVDWQTGALTAYPRPMALSPWSRSAAGDPDGLQGDRETVLRARDLGAPVDPAPGPVTHVVLLSRSDDSGKSTLEEESRNAALAELLQRGFTFHQDGGRALQLLADVLRQATVLRVLVGDPREAAALLTATLDV